MSGVQHTPGPWYADRYGKVWGNRMVRERSNAILFSYKIAEAIGHEFAVDGSNQCRVRNAVQRADANLIAAAPELLEACKLSQEVEEHFRSCEDCDQDDGAFCEAAVKLAHRAETKRIDAIAKAEGGAA